MAQFVNVYRNRAPIGFVFRSLARAACSDDLGRLRIALSLIHARTWKRFPIFWAMLRQWRDFSPATRTSLICAVIARHPRALRWLRRRAVVAASGVPETARRLELLVQLAHYFQPDERSPILAEAADAFLELFGRQQAARRLLVPVIAFRAHAAGTTARVERCADARANSASHRMGKPQT
jgi:hypothetical protein